MEVVSHFKMTPLTILYYEEEDVLAWKEFLEQEITTKVIPPSFTHLPSPQDDEASM